MLGRIPLLVFAISGRIFVIWNQRLERNVLREERTKDASNHNDLLEAE